jgi:hypothetical protein
MAQHQDSVRDAGDARLFRAVRNVDVSSPVRSSRRTTLATYSGRWTTMPGLGATPSWNMPLPNSVAVTEGSSSETAIPSLASSSRNTALSMFTADFVAA